MEIPARDLQKSQPPRRHPTPTPIDSQRSLLLFVKRPFGATGCRIIARETDRRDSEVGEASGDGRVCG